MSRFGTALLMLSLGISMIFVYQNCGVPGAGMSPSLVSPNEKVTADDLVRLYQSIEGLNSQNLSCSNDSECGTLALGAKACGGPQKYVIVSSQNSALERISAMAAELDSRERTYNEENQVTSNCSMVMEPQASCISNICQ